MVSSPGPWEAQRPRPRQASGALERPPAPCLGTAPFSTKRDAAPGSTTCWQSDASQLQPRGRHGPWDKPWKEQDRDREGAWRGKAGSLACNASSPSPPEPPGAAGSSIPVYCALLATVVFGLLVYVAFKCWRSHQQRQQLAKAQAAELGALDRDPRHGESSVLLDSPSGLAPCAPSQGPHPEFGRRLYRHLPWQQQEEVERLLGVSGDPDKGWQGLAGRLGYQTETVETMARGQAPACALLRDWAVQGGSGATLRVLEDALASMGREDVARVLSLPPEGCSVV